MLKKLCIQNHALIDLLELDFSEGMNIITGETGAGKSILLDALSLILGQRADSSSVLDAKRKSVVEGEFYVGHPSEQIRHYLHSNDLDISDSVILRREIAPEGKSRAFINDTPVNLNQLKEFSSMLVDVHSQHETLLLNKSAFQIQVLDGFAGNSTNIRQYRELYQNLQSQKKFLADLKAQSDKLKADQDYLKFQLNELEAAGLIEGEQEKLEADMKLATNSEGIARKFEELIMHLSGSDSNLLGGIRQCINASNTLKDLNPELNQLHDRLKSIEIELKDIEAEIENASSAIILNPESLIRIEERLDVIYSLQKKHRKKSVEELLEFQLEIKNKLDSIESTDEDVKRLEVNCEKAQLQLIKLAREISEQRKVCIPKFEKSIKNMLANLSMPHAALKVEVSELPQNTFNQSGIDEIDFLFSANKGSPYTDLRKVASGGELSRLMLCIKSSVAKLVSLPTLILDEIDSGVSGETAMNIGMLMQEMSEGMQMIVITHLPQIASRGKSHYFVYKEVKSDKTYTRVKKLDEDSRIVEVARMLSGNKPSSSALQNAKELLSN
ncbi:MAG: DNA repair protein RecN [Bacteroidetes bacterium]|nr:MAG: DNA repair protein RecN [Bacteroidota bacterium]REJ99839.1 MAG: DNA repair protein RecN [Bacteroidota bacterium]REK34212.1 MAG: DNA repair protein RecN [Bacteroidota bacterium]REK50542.1 MAG: DNA repair protein RecN [Bacteroidota bacterium]